MQITPDPYIDTRLEIRHIDKIGGWGIFAKETIPVSELVEVAPVVIYPKVLMDVAVWSCQAEGIPNKDLMLDQYAIHWNGSGAMPLGWVGLYNHSDNNNAEFTADYGRKLIGIITIREIQPNEQICVSYGDDWFAKKPYVPKVEF
jgi:hypothetical protein